MNRVFFCFIYIVLLFGCLQQKSSYVQESYDTIDDYMISRQRLIQAERNMRFDARIHLAPEEDEANRRLMELKRNEIERTREYFPPAHNFLKSETRKLIDESPILEIMKRMPKGGILHVHGALMGDYRWLVNQATYHPACYIYNGNMEPSRKGALRIFEENPGDGWELVSELRKTADNVEEFDEELYKSVTLGEEDLSQQDIWNEFSNCFRRSSGMFSDEIYDGYLSRMLEDLVAENIQYVEARGGVWDEDKIEQIQHEHPEFHVKYIHQSGRSSTREILAKRLDYALELRVADPHLHVGFDLVEEEDKQHTNLFFINELLEARRKAEKLNTTFPLYLHSGETNWMDNENIIDAILLNAKRIGHGISLFKHPLLMEIVKERNIAIEVCPISNQVLGYVADLRNHPASLYINSGLPVVICPDDPSIWRCTFSYDFYAAFMAWGLDLKCLKQLAMNSLIYSAMGPEEKKQALEFWRNEWAKFITWMNDYLD